jgi:hypothetical protein
MEQQPDHYLLHSSLAGDKVFAVPFTILKKLCTNVGPNPHVLTFFIQV